MDKDEKYIYKKIDITKEDVIEFVEIVDEKLVALLNEGYEFSLFIEPYFNYTIGGDEQIYRNTARELYAMLPNRTGTENLKKLVNDSMQLIYEENPEFFEDFANEYKDFIPSKMLNKGYAAYYFGTQIFD